MFLREMSSVGTPRTFSRPQTREIPGHRMRSKLGRGEVLLDSFCWEMAYATESSRGLREGWRPWVAR